MSRRFYYRFLVPPVLVLLLLVSSSLLPSASGALSVTATFNQSGISGEINFTQEAPGRNTTITVSLRGFGRFPGNTFPFPWHVHEYPFPHDGVVTPCGAGITGGHFDPLGANENPNYSIDCSMQTPQDCEVGDLSGKFGKFTNSDPFNDQYSDPYLSLYGVNSIVGRSIVIHFTNGSRLVCANIGYPGSSNPQLPSGGGLLYSPFRNSFTGSIFYRQHIAGNSTTSVYTNLERIVGERDSMGHNWHVHRSPLDAGGTNCTIAGPHYNPRNVDISNPSYAERCGSENSTRQMNCEIGDLSSKGDQFDVVNGRVRQLYTDTDLPILRDVDGNSIDNRSVVIHAENGGSPRIACTNVTRFRPLEAVSLFNENGVSGSIRFYQLSPYDPTQVTVALRGLGAMADGYHVHEFPVGPQNIGSPGKCASKYTGGHWNPTNVTTSGSTSDQFEIGDLSGKFGGLSGLEELEAVYTDPNVPLFGPFSVIGRSIVIHLADSSRWVCADVQRTRQFLQITTMISTSSFSGNVTFIQLADDPFAETTIVVSIDVHQMLQPPVVVSSSTPLVDMLSSTVATTIDIVPTTTNTIAMTTNVADMTTNGVTMTTDSMVMSTSSVVMTSSPAAVMPPPSSSLVQELPTSSMTSQAVQPEPTPSTPSPLTSSIVEDGSGSSLLIPFSREDTTVSPTNSPSQRRRRKSVDGRRQRRQSGDLTVPFEWSVRVQDGSSGTSTISDCAALPMFSPFMSNSELCSSTSQLACSSGDLTSKHGTLSLPRQPGSSFRAVFTDPNLPLSGSDSALFLLIQPVNAAMMSSENAVCTEQGAPVLVEPPPLTVAPPTSAPPTTIGSTQASQADNTAVIIGGAVGGAVLAVILFVLLLVIIVVCVKRKTSSGYNLAKSAYYELGTINHSKPILGVPNYKALYDYKPQNDDDLELAVGDWVTLIETPLGGNWWRGSNEGRGEGWFPKNFVKYVDVEAEKKKREAENFKLAAAAIVAASTSFSTRHPSLSRKKRDNVDAEPKRSQTFSRRDIDSTPKMVTKFDQPYLDRIEPPDAIVISNAVTSTASGSLPGTPLSQRSASEVITNKLAMEGGSSENSQEDSEVKKDLSESDPLTSNSEFIMSVEKYVAKHEFGGSTDIELQFKKGSVITVIEKADNGWWKGICEGQVGWFPETYVRPVPIETKKQEPTREEAAPDEIGRPRGMDEMMASGGDLEATEYRTVFAYNSDTRGDLSFGEGEMVLVYWADENGWWFGSAGSAQGWFPGSYVEPVVEMSEAGSMVASPIHEEAEAEEDKNDGGLAGQLAAAIKKRKTKKVKEDTFGEDKDSRSSFRKRWSLRRKSQRDKNKGSPSANTPQDSPAQRKQVEPVVQAATAGEEKTREGRKEEDEVFVEKERLLSNSSEGGIQGELASAIVRRNSIGREATMSIDERLAKSKQQRESEPQNELLNALKKRKVSVEKTASVAERKAAPAEVKSPVETQPVVLEDVTVATGSSQEISESPKQEEAKPALVAPPTTTPAPKEKESVEEKPVTPKTPEPAPKPVKVTSPTTPTTTPITQGAPQHHKTPVAPRSPNSSAHKMVAGKPRRRPPPPPATLAAVGATPTTPANKVSPPTVSAQPSPSLRKMSAPSPTLHEKPKTTPTAAIREADRKPHPSKTEATPDGTDKSGRSYTTTASTSLGAGGKKVSQPRARPKRQATSGDLKPKYPARRPPPPPPGAPVSPPTKEQGKGSPLSSAAKKTIASNGEVAVGTPTQGKRTPPSRNVRVAAPPRAKARVQKVKRPMSRMIPPPPNIPLPPPPARKTTPTTSKTQVKSTATSESVQATPSTQPLPAAATPPQASHPPVVSAPKPTPRGPKPAPPARVSSLTPEPRKKLRLTPTSHPATIVEATNSQSKSTATKPSSPPTRRDLASIDGALASSKPAPVPAKRQLPSEEDTDAPLVTDSPLNRKASKSAPPQRPPPPRPPSVTSNTITKVQVNPDKPVSKPVKPERPPQIGAESPPTKRGDSNNKVGVVPLLGSSSKGKVLFDATALQGSTAPEEAGHDVKSRGGGFMKSLKKIVKRESSTDTASPDHKPTIERKTPPTSRGGSFGHKNTSVNGAATKTESPKSPPARPTSAGTKENGPTSVSKAPPTRPPPLKISDNHETEQKPAESAPAKEILKSPSVETEAPKPRPRKPEVGEVDKADKAKETVAVEEKKEGKTAVGSQIPSRPPPPRTSPSEKRHVSIPSRPPPPKTPVNKTPTESFEREHNSVQSPRVSSPNSIPDKPKPMPVPRKEVTTELTQKNNGSVSSPPPAPVPTPRQKSSSPPPDASSPTNPTGTNFYRATKDYKSQSDGELSFVTGDVIIFMERREKGLYYGMLDNGQTGLFPTNHVEAFFH